MSNLSETSTHGIVQVRAYYLSQKGRDSFWHCGSCWINIYSDELIVRRYWSGNLLFVLYGPISELHREMESIIPASLIWWERCVRNSHVVAEILVIYSDSAFLHVRELSPLVVVHYPEDLYHIRAQSMQQVSVQDFAGLAVSWMEIIHSSHRLHVTHWIPVFRLHLS